MLFLAHLCSLGDVRGQVGRSFWERFGASTGIAAQRWRSVLARRQKATLEMLEVLTAQHPEYAFWLMTGATDAANGHIAPINAVRAEGQAIELDSAQARIGELENSLAELRESLAEFGQRATLAEQRAEEIERRARELRAELDRAHQDTDRLRQDHDHAVCQVKAAEIERDISRKEASQAREEVATLRGRAEALETVIEKAAKKNAKYLIG